jgi:hypothetical protein
MDAGEPAFHCPIQTPQGINNLGEALTAICTLTAFPLTPGAPAYTSWEARLGELTKNMQHHAALACSHSLARVASVMTAHYGGVMAATANRGACHS